MSESKVLCFECATKRADNLVETIIKGFAIDRSKITYADRSALFLAALKVTMRKMLAENRRAGPCGSVRFPQSRHFKIRMTFFSLIAGCRCGWGCDVCSGGYDVKTFMSLRIGFYKARLYIDLCEPCAKRLASVVDARLEDKRRRP